MENILGQKATLGGATDYQGGPEPLADASQRPRLGT